VRGTCHSFSVLLLLLFVLGGARASGVFNIVTYGAKGDGSTDNTKAFSAASAACTSAGGGQVLVPAGKYLTNPFTITGATIDLHIDQGATILAYPNPSNWPSNPSSLIAITNANGGSISGPGTIDGQGAQWWLNPNAQRPDLITIKGSNNFLIDGPTFQNSPMFHIVPSNCNNMEIKGISILAPPSPTSHNTDGIDPSYVNGLHIHDSYINNGDDNVAIKEGTQNVLVENCVFGYGHGASIGSVIGGTNQNITFRNISFTNTSAGVRIKTQPGCTGSVKGIVFENLVMKNVDDLIVIDMFYSPGCGSGHTGIDIDGVIIKDISGSGTHVGYFNCSNYMPCTNIQLININISGKDSNKFTCSNAYGTASNVTPPSCLLSN